MSTTKNQCQGKRKKPLDSKEHAVEERGCKLSRVAPSNENISVEALQKTGEETIAEVTEGKEEASAEAMQGKDTGNVCCLNGDKAPEDVVQESGRKLGEGEDSDCQKNVIISCEDLKNVFQNFGTVKVLL